MIEQRTQEWFEKRKGKVTGSNIGAILGVNPYKKPEDVIRQMVRDYHGAEPEFKGNAATEWGSYNEAGVQAEFEMETGLKVVECGFYVHPIYRWLGASPDGLVGEKELVEIKCPYGLRNEESPTFKSIDEQPFYWAQIQLQLACTGRQKCHFYQWTPKATSLEVVDFDSEWFYQSALPKLEEFYQLYLKELKNPEHLEEKRVTLAFEEAVATAERLQKVRALADELKAEEKELKAKLTDMSKGRNLQAGSLKLSKVKRAGSVSWEKVAKELMPDDFDLKPFTGKEFEYWRVG